MMIHPYYVTTVEDGSTLDVITFLKNNTLSIKMMKINYTNAETAENAVSVIKPFLHHSNPLFAKSVTKEYIRNAISLIKKTITSSKKMMLQTFSVSHA